MEKQPETIHRVQITKAVFDGLEFIRRSGATNMLDRPMVLNLAREWDFTETADWIESVDTGTYGRLIFQGPDVIEDDLADQEIENDLDSQDIEGSLSNGVDENDAINEIGEIDLTDMAMDTVRGTMQDLITHLGKRATLTIADTYETERMGVPFDPSRKNLISAERNALIRSLGQASSLWLQLDEVMAEVQRGIGSLQYLTDPENN